MKVCVRSLKLRLRRSQLPLRSSISRVLLQIAIVRVVTCSNIPTGMKREKNHTYFFAVHVPRLNQPLFVLTTTRLPHPIASDSGRGSLISRRLPSHQATDAFHMIVPEHLSIDQNVSIIVVSSMSNLAY
jgi:hypothetical protein